MGCSSSVQVKKTDANGNGHLANLTDDEHLEDKGENLTNKISTMASTALPAKSDYLNGIAADHGNNSKVANNKSAIDASSEELESDSELTTESEDKVDSSLKPPTHKEHATQNTLNFVYKHGTATSPNHTGGTFPLFSGGGGYQKSGLIRSNNGSKRRPSGVPPPVRALKPDDFLYRRTMNSRRHSDMAEEVEEKENEENT